MTIDVSKSELKLELALELSRQEIIKKNGFIDFLYFFPSNKENTKTNNFALMFNPLLWQELSKKTGHSKLRHVITKVVIEFVVHEAMMDPGAMVTCANQIQMHVNRLGNFVFGFKKDNWKIRPNISKIAKKFFSNLKSMEAKESDHPHMSCWKPKSKVRKPYESETSLLTSIYLKKPHE